LKPPYYVVLKSEKDRRVWELLKRVHDGKYPCYALARRHGHRKCLLYIAASPVIGVKAFDRRMIHLKA